MSSDDNQHQLPLVPHVYQGNLIQQRAADGYINATAMCKAAGKLFNDYSRLKFYDPFLAALEGSTGIPVDRLVLTIMDGPNDHRGTWIHPQVAIHLAQWLSPEFAVQVTEWVYEWMSGKHPSEKVWQQFQDRVSLVYDNVPIGYFCVFRELAEVFASLISNGATFGTKMVLDISVGQHWAIHWRDNDLGNTFGERAFFDHYYPGYFPQSFSNPQESACYPDTALPTFRRWLHEVYVPIKMPDYLKRQVQQKKLPAQIANDALAALERRERRRALPRPNA